MCECMRCSVYDACAVLIQAQIVVDGVGLANSLPVRIY